MHCVSPVEGSAKAVSQLAKAVWRVSDMGKGEGKERIDDDDLHGKVGCGGGSTLVSTDCELSLKELKDLHRLRHLAFPYCRAYTS